MSDSESGVDLGRPLSTDLDGDSLSTRASRELQSARFAAAERLSSPADDVTDSGTYRLMDVFGDDGGRLRDITIRIGSDDSDIDAEPDAVPDVSDGMIPDEFARLGEDEETELDLFDEFDETRDVDDDTDTGEEQFTGPSESDRGGAGQQLVRRPETETRPDPQPSTSRPGMGVDDMFASLGAGLVGSSVGVGGVETELREVDGDEMTGAAVDFDERSTGMLDDGLGFETGTTVDITPGEIVAPVEGVGVGADTTPAQDTGLDTMLDEGTAQRTAQESGAGEIGSVPRFDGPEFQPDDEDRRRREEELGFVEEQQVFDIASAQDFVFGEES